MWRRTATARSATYQCRDIRQIWPFKIFLEDSRSIRVGNTNTYQSTRSQSWETNPGTTSSFFRPASGLRCFCSLKGKQVMKCCDVHVNHWLRQARCGMLQSTQFPYDEFQHASLGTRMGLRPNKSNNDDRNVPPRQRNGSEPQDMMWHDVHSHIWYISYIFMDDIRERSNQIERIGFIHLSFWTELMAHCVILSKRRCFFVIPSSKTFASWFTPQRNCVFDSQAEFLWSEQPPPCHVCGNSRLPVRTRTVWNSRSFLVVQEQNKIFRTQHGTRRERITFGTYENIFQETHGVQKVADNQRISTPRFLLAKERTFQWECKKNDCGYDETHQHDRFKNYQTVLCRLVTSRGLLLRFETATHNLVLLPTRRHPSESPAMYFLGM